MKEKCIFLSTEKLERSSTAWLQQITSNDIKEVTYAISGKEKSKSRLSWGFVRCFMHCALCTVQCQLCFPLHCAPTETGPDPPCTSTHFTWQTWLIPLKILIPARAADEGSEGKQTDTLTPSHISGILPCRGSGILVLFISGYEG